MHMLIHFALLSSIFLVNVSGLFQVEKTSVSVTDLSVEIRYSWTASERDLDTHTYLADAGESDGFNCPDAGNKFVKHIRDEDGDVGVEITNIAIGSAFSDKDVSFTKDVAVVQMFAGWYNTGDDKTQVDATATAIVRQTSTNQVLFSGSVTIKPENGLTLCADKLVAQLKITKTGAKTSTIDLSNENLIGVPTKPVSYMVAGCTGDPHCTTYNGIKYDCQGTGEFVLSRYRPIFEFQARFGKRITTPWGTKVSLTTAVAIDFPLEKNLLGPKVTLAIRSNVNTPATMVEECPIVLFVNNKNILVSDAEGKTLELSSKNPPTDLFKFTKNGNRFTMEFMNGIKLTTYAAKFVNTCFLEGMNLQIPNGMTGPQGTQFEGMLGKPDSDMGNDWDDKNGGTAPSTREERLFKYAYDYCVSNFCITNEKDSIFTYEPGFSHANYAGCDLQFTGRMGVRKMKNSARQQTVVPANIQSICQGDEFCEVDGVAGGPAEARKTLKVNQDFQALVDDLSALTFEPKKVKKFIPQVVTVRLNLKDKLDDDLKRVTGFAVWNYNPETQADISYLGELTDEKNDAIANSIAADKVYDGQITLFALNDATKFSFRIYALIDFEEDQESDFRQFKNDAVTVE